MCLLKRAWQAASIFVAQAMAARTVPDRRPARSNAAAAPPSAGVASSAQGTQPPPTASASASAPPAAYVDTARRSTASRPSFKPTFAPSTHSAAATPPAPGSAAWFAAAASRAGVSQAAQVGTLLMVRVERRARVRCAACVLRA